MTPLVLALPGNERLAAGIAAVGGFELGEIETRRFPDGETYLRLISNVSGRSVALVCTLSDPDAKLMALLLAAGTARELGAIRVGLVAPYLAYMRQDHRFHHGEAVSAIQFARILSPAIDWLVTVDPHLHRIKRLDEIYRVPAVSLHAGPLLARWIGDRIDRPLLVGPDAESEQWVAAAASVAGAPHVVATKHRLGDREVRIEVPDLSRWRGRTPVLVDDVASSGRTLITCATTLRERGLTQPACAVVHGIFASDAYASLAELCDPIVTTNTIAHPSNGIDVAPILVDEVARLCVA